ncbi:MAG: DUF6455 family protein [Gammaproteobacteria bacterium]|nr:DUF6455 family protein [Gammaproteobacteria bacterium]
MLGFFILSLLLVAMLALAVALSWSIAGNLRQGDAVRLRLARRLETLRLGRALTLFGVDVEDYLYAQRVVEIQAQMRSCNDCRNPTRCDDTLRRGADGEFDFCPNGEVLGALRDAASPQRSQQ